MTEDAILQALWNRLEAFVAANPIALATPGITYVPKEGEPYLEATILPAETDSFGLNIDQHLGIFQVDCKYPEKQGLKPPIEKAAQIIAYFPRNTVMAHEGVVVKVSRRPWYSTPLREPGWRKVPVSIRYHAFV